jgi:hypothetical protein
VRVFAFQSQIEFAVKAFTLDRTGGNLSGPPAAWKFEREFDAKVGEHDAILAEIARVGYSQTRVTVSRVAG